MHNFIKFHFGPHWSLQIQGNSRTSKISLTEIRTCLSQLPFLYTNGRLSIRSCDALCSSEQVQVSEELRSRLTENMLSCCNATFIHQSQQQSAHNRNSFFSSRPKHQSFDFNEMTKTTTTTTWAYCFLFAREKIVAQCRNTDELPDDFIYFLKLLVSHYLQEKHETGKKLKINHVGYYLLFSINRKYHSIYHITAKYIINVKYIILHKSTIYFNISTLVLLQQVLLLLLIIQWLLQHL